jgi:hypothetical protein
MASNWTLSGSRDERRLCKLRPGQSSAQESRRGDSPSSRNKVSPEITLNVGVAHRIRILSRKNRYVDDL